MMYIGLCTCICFTGAISRRFFLLSLTLVSRLIFILYKKKDEKSMIFDWFTHTQPGFICFYHSPFYTSVVDCLPVHYQFITLVFIVREEKRFISWWLMPANVIWCDCIYFIKYIFAADYLAVCYRWDTCGQNAETWRRIKKVYASLLSMKYNQLPKQNKKPYSTQESRMISF